MEYPAIAGTYLPTRIIHERLTIDPKTARTEGRNFPRPMGKPLRLTASLPCEVTIMALMRREGSNPGFNKHKMRVPNESHQLSW